ncbi:MAG: hypothetical protein J6W60_02455 [Treponema sp.]|nr:hypothetical protein [Treponema sp.]MBP5751708.1 hypothetical protein [Treponema sp.]
MKKLGLLTCFLFFTLSSFAIDYDKVSTRVLPTLTDDEIFIGQCANEKELALLLEKGFKYTFDRTLENSDEIVKSILSHMESKKIYNKEFELAEKQNKKRDVLYCYHVDLDFDEIVQIINTFKSKLEKSSDRYYLVCMQDGYRDGYIIVYDVKKKEVFLQYGHPEGVRFIDKFFNNWY